MRARSVLLTVAVGASVACCAPVSAATLGITADGRYFTIDGAPTYLLGVSYYGAQTISTPEFVTQDLDDMVARGFNWIRVWSTWDATDTGSGDCSVLTPAGAVREPYMTRLKTLIAECNNRGMIVDVSMCRGSGGPNNLAEHLAYAQILATHLASYPNVYFDIANECDVQDSRYVPPSEITQIVARCKQYKPGVLCTASQGATSASDLYNKYIATGCDFMAPHLCRDQGCAAQTYGTVANFITWMGQYGRRMPVQLQEPFRRGYGSYNPVLNDFLTDCAGGKDAQAAGWCFHNGWNNGSRPYRCFDMRDGEGRLFAQIDSEEWQVVNQVYGHISGTALAPGAPVIREVTPDPAAATVGVQYFRPMVLTQGNPWPTWLMVQGPSGAQINMKGQVSWTPTSADIGQTRTFEVQATNTHGSDTETWQVTVQTGPVATFEAEGAGMGHQIGRAITGGWRAMVTDAVNQFSTYGPYTTSLPTGPLVARFWLRVDNNTADNAGVCQIDVNDFDGGTLLAGPVTITRQQWTQANVYQAFDLSFTNPGNNHRLEFRTYYLGAAQLDEDKIDIWYSDGNYPPSVSAGADQQVSWPSTVNLDGTVADDGLPNPPGATTVTWSKVSGPGTVTFGNANAVDTTATLGASGVYVLRLSTTDSMYAATDDVTIYAPGAGDFVISAEEFIGSGTLGDTENAWQLVHGRCDSAGNLHVVWYKNGAIAYRKKLNGGGWGAEETVPDSSGMNLDGPRLAVTPGGDVHVFWNPPAWNPLYYSIRTSSGWGSRQTLIYNADGDHASTPVPVFLADGRLFLVWLRWDGTDNWYYRIKTGSTWSSDQPVSPHMYDGYAAVTDGSNNVYAAGRVLGNPHRAGYQVWNGTWGAVQTPATDVNHWVGGTHIAWRSGSPLALTFAGYEESGGVWYTEGVYSVLVGQSSVRLTQAAQVGVSVRCEDIDPKVVYDSQGNHYYVWTDGDQLRYAIRKADGTWYAKDLNFPVGGGKQYFPDITAFGDTVHVLWEDNRGGMYHATITPPGGANAPPVVDAGLDQTITLPASATLDATVTDDGNPNPPGQVIVTWSKQSGPGEVVFGDAHAADTTASFSQAGTYVLRLSATDSQWTSEDDVTITVDAPVIPDFDGDSDVDQSDFGVLQQCCSGSAKPYAPGCEGADLDDDGDVDQSDFDVFLTCLGGPGQTAQCGP